MNKKEAWLGHNEHRTNSCKPMSDEKQEKKLRRAFARKTEHKHTTNEFGTVSLVNPTQDQLKRVGLAQ